MLLLLFYIIIIILLLLLSMMILIIGFACPPFMHFKFIQSVTVYFITKMRWSVITKCDIFFITQCNKCYYKVRQNKVEEQEKQLKSGGGGGGCRKAIEMCKSKKGRRKTPFSWYISQFAFLLIKNERFAGQESLNGNCNHFFAQ